MGFLGPVNHELDLIPNTRTRINTLIQRLTISLDPMLNLMQGKWHMEHMIVKRKAVRMEIDNGNPKDLNYSSLYT